MSSKLQKIIEEWLPEMHDVPTEFDTGSENSTPRLIRANGYNNAIKDIKSKIPQLEQSIMDEIETAIIEHKKSDFPFPTLQESSVREIINHLTK